jgi:hypothetical protein
MKRVVLPSPFRDIIVCCSLVYKAVGTTSNDSGGSVFFLSALMRYPIAHGCQKRSLVRSSHHALESHELVSACEDWTRGGKGRSTVGRQSLASGSEND